jgi:membrane protein implicated in regulation of membrane protease activity
MSPLIQTSEDDDEHFSAWPLIVAIAIAKIVTLVVVLYFAWGGEAAALIGATTLPWVVVAVGLLAAPVTWQVRMRRMRRRRKALQDAEWMRDPREGPNPPAALSPKPANRKY